MCISIIHMYIREMYVYCLAAQLNFNYNDFQMCPQDTSVVLTPASVSCSVMSEEQ